MANNPFASILAGARLSAEESAEFAAHVAQLARSGLPLDEGLRSLADEMPGGRLAGVLRDVANRLQAGQPLDAALDSQKQAVPAHLRGLILAGVRTGRLPEMLEEYVEVQRNHGEIRRRAFLAVAYPACLMVLLCFILLIMQFFVIGQFGRMFNEFGLCLPQVTVFIIAIFSHGLWIALAGTVLVLIVPVLLWLAPHLRLASFCLNWIPAIGPLTRWSRLSEFSHWMALMIGNEVPLPEALRLTAGSLRNASLARGCRRVAAKVEAGQLLSDGIAGQRQFPARFVPVIAWGERSQSLAESFRAIAGMCDEVLHVRAVVAQAILLPVFLLAIMTFIGVCLLGLFMPLFSLVSNLAGPPSYSHQHHSDAILAADLPYEWIIAGILAAVLGLVFVALFTQKNWASGCGHETWLLTFLATLLSVIVWGIGLLALLCVACFFLGPIGFVLWGIFVGVVVELFRQRRSTRQYSLLWLLTVSVEKGIPLSPTVAAFAGEFQGKWRYQTMRLAAKLAGGISLPEALEQLPGLLPAAAIPLVRVGCDAGNLATALQKAGKGRLLCHTLYQSVVGKAFYLACVAFFAICCYTFIGYKIIPSFEKMLSEFGLKPPLPLVFFVDVLYLCCDSGLAAVLFLLVLFVLIYWGLRYFDVIQWRLPGVGWFVRNLDRAVVLDTLALSAAQGQPLTNGLDALAQSYPDGGIRSRLQKAAADIARGRDWMGSLFARGLLGRADSAVLRTAQQVGNLSWAMEEMADSNRRRFAYRGQIWLQVLFPAVILLLGVVVMFVVVPVFSCLISLIEHLV